MTTLDTMGCFVIPYSLVIDEFDFWTLFGKSKKEDRAAFNKLTVTGSSVIKDVGISLVVIDLFRSDVYESKLVQH